MEITKQDKDDSKHPIQGRRIPEGRRDDKYDVAAQERIDEITIGRRCIRGKIAETIEDGEVSFCVVYTTNVGVPIAHQKSEQVSTEMEKPTKYPRVAGIYVETHTQTYTKTH